MKTTDKNTLDYTQKLINKLPTNIKSEDINNLVMFFNYCFREKNNFLIPNFNNKMFNEIYLIYNKLKTNILNDDINNIVSEFDINKLKTIRFILINLESVKNNNNNNTNNNLCFFSNDSVRRLIHFLTAEIKKF